MSAGLWPRWTPLAPGPMEPVWQRWWSDVARITGTLTQYVQFGDGAPEGVVTAPQGARYQRWDGGVGTILYVKTSGGILTPTNTGWIAL